MDNFNVKRVVLLNADDTIPDDIYLSQSDADGRKLSIQLTDNSVISDTTGYSLKLVFTTDKEYSYDFEEVDLTIGLYEITYPSELRKSLGDVNCEIWICSGTKITATKSFAVNVGKSVITGEPIVADDEFTTLQNMIIAVQGLETNYAPRLTAVEEKVAPESLKALTDYLHYQKVGNVVTVALYDDGGTSITATSYAKTTIGSLPIGYRPTSQLGQNAFTRNASNGTIYNGIALNIATDGTISLYNNTGTSITVNQIYSTISYIVA